MCRNHRGFLESVVASSKLGANTLFLNTAFSGPQLADVSKREKPKALIYDHEFEELIHDASRRRKRYIAWHDPEDGKTDDPRLEDLVERGDTADVSPPPERGKAVILTSGTTGTPKGASRSQPRSLDPAAALLAMIPLKAREKTMIAAPMFHSWGFVHFTLGMSLSSTVVLNRKFDPETTLQLTAQHECTALVVVPVMMQRILELPEDVLTRYDLSKLRVVAVSGSALPGDLSERWMDVFGDNVYNLYGSTEVAWATIATPEDLRAAPGTAGRPPHGTIVKLYDDDGKPVKPGETGRIFVGNEMQFEGYTGGGGKDVIDGLLSSGDVGHFDKDGRLFVDGRDDDMIVSGGENVFPAEVEDLLAAHQDIVEVAVFGVDDEKFGQRLKAVVVLKGGAKLSEDDIKKHVKSNLAGYKVPRVVEFMDELPRTSTGKVLKRELKDDSD
jgi:fatty-acyl-CoA synthase